MPDLRNKIAIVVRETRLEGLLQRWATRGAARFRLQQLHAHQTVPASPTASSAAKRKKASTTDAEFADYEAEDETYKSAVEQVRRGLAFEGPVEVVHRRFLPNYDFGRCLLVIVVGQDGLVANTAKYVGELPIVAVNPDPQRFDGVLLPFAVSETAGVVASVLAGRAKVRRVTLAEVVLNDGQRLLAFNDIFIGIQGHASARYVLGYGGEQESQSSSGIIVSTGAGSTGWFSSISNMAAGVTQWLGGEPKTVGPLEWETRRLLWAVREPFLSRHSSCSLVAGVLDEAERLVVESLMPERGIVFSDGIEADYLEFPSGTLARVGCAEQQAQLVVPGKG